MTVYLLIVNFDSTPRASFYFSEYMNLSRYRSFLALWVSILRSGRAYNGTGIPVFRKDSSEIRTIKTIQVDILH